MYRSRRRARDNPGSSGFRAPVEAVHRLAALLGPAEAETLLLRVLARARHRCRMARKRWVDRERGAGHEDAWARCCGANLAEDALRALLAREALQRFPEGFHGKRRAREVLRGLRRSGFRGRPRTPRIPADALRTPGVPGYRERGRYAFPPVQGTPRGTPALAVPLRAPATPPRGSDREYRPVGDPRRGSCARGRPTPRRDLGGRAIPVDLADWSAGRDARRKAEQAAIAEVLHAMSWGPGLDPEALALAARTAGTARDPARRREALAAQRRGILLQCRKAAEMAWRGMTGEAVRAMAARARRFGLRPSALFAWMIQRLPKTVAEPWMPRGLRLAPLPPGVHEIHWGRFRHVRSHLSSLFAKLKGPSK